MVYTCPADIQRFQAEFLRNATAGVLNNPLLGTTVEHWSAEHTPPENFTEGHPEYLAPNPGLYESGVEYFPNPANPLKGVFCRAKVTPYQDKSGIHFQAQMSLYLPIDLGPVFILDAKYPKRQDMFVINGIRYYAVAPSMPCQAGDTIAVWQIDLNRERCPVQHETYESWR